MKKILFLDFDGVMVTDRHQAQLMAEGQPLRDSYGTKFDQVCVEFLKQILNATKADLVVTSTWKMEMGLEGIQRMWHERQLPGRVIDVTPDIDPIHRGNEIAGWLDACGDKCRYAIIDDTPFTDFFRKEQLPYLFKVDEHTGLDEVITKQVIDYLTTNEL